MSAQRPALFRALHDLDGRLPWRSLGRFPTRVHRLDGLLPPRVELWVKRDDESSPLYGGNKVRKLEFLLADALERRARVLITSGAWGSHHVLATALFGQALGLLVEAAVFPQPLTPAVIDNLLMVAQTGARLMPLSSPAEVPLHQIRARLTRGALWIPPGGSSGLGALGHVSGALELMEQVRARQCPMPDLVYAPLGSCGTIAGLWLGLSLGGYTGELVGVRVVDRIVSNRPAARRIASEAARLLRRGAAPISFDGATPPLLVDERFFGAGYGSPTPEGQEAIRLCSRLGLSLEPTYTAKTMASVLADARAGLLDGKRVLFLATYSSADLSPHLPPGRDPQLLPPPLRPLLDEVEPLTVARGPRTRR